MVPARLPLKGLADASGKTGLTGTRHCFRALLLTLAVGVLGAQTTPVAGQVIAEAHIIQLLKYTQICAADDPCVATPERKAKLAAMITATESWLPIPTVQPADTPAGAPADAIVLFDGKGLDRWTAADGTSPADWPSDGAVLTVNKAVGSIRTKDKFGDYQLHVEWRVPADITGTGQERGNSGVFLGAHQAGAGFEIQILDSWSNKTYVNGQAGSLYKQFAPLVNASRKPGDWQTFDIVWTAPKFKMDGSLNSPAYVTLFHNGVLVQDHVAASGETDFVRTPRYRSFSKAEIELQAHRDPSAPISFRNIWLRPIEPTAKTADH